MKLGAPTPILRIFDVAKAREFYLEYLGFVLRWEHRFAEDFPLYMEIARGGCVLHLSEHHGDGSPGSTIRVEVEGIEDFHRELLARHYRYAKPGLSETSWGTREFSLADPFGNNIRFFQQLSAATDAATN